MGAEELTVSVSVDTNEFMAAMTAIEDLPAKVLRKAFGRTPVAFKKLGSIHRDESSGPCDLRLVLKPSALLLELAARQPQ